MPNLDSDKIARVIANSPSHCGSNPPAYTKIKGLTMQIDWKWFLIGLVLGLLLGCQPTTEYQNYYIWEQIGG